MHTHTHTYVLNIYKQHLHYAELHGSTRFCGRTFDTRTSYSLDLGFLFSAHKLAILLLIRLSVRIFKATAAVKLKCLFVWDTASCYWVNGRRAFETA